MGLQEAGCLEEEESLGLVEADKGMGWKEVAACLLKEAVGLQEAQCLQEVLVLGEADRGKGWKEVEGHEAGYREEEESLRWGEVDKGMCLIMAGRGGAGQGLLFAGRGSLFFGGAGRPSLVSIMFSMLIACFVQGKVKNQDVPTIMASVAANPLGLPFLL